MSVVVPNHIKAVVELLKGNADVVSSEQAALVTTLHTRVSATRIGYEWDDAWVIDATGRIHPAITVERDGGFGADLYVPRAQGRFLLRCWAPFYHTALEAAQIVAQILMPVSPGIGGWTAGNTQVFTVTGLSDPDEFQDPDFEYRRAMQSIGSCRYSRIAVAAV